MPWRAEVEHGIKARGLERRDEADWVGMLEQLQKKKGWRVRGGAEGKKNHQTTRKAERCVEATGWWSPRFFAVGSLA